MSHPRRAPTIAQVVGQRLVELRGERGLTQEQAGNVVREMGLNWKTSKLVALEVGRRESISVAELVQLSAAFQVKMGSWFAGEGPIRADFTGQEMTTRAEMRDLFNQALPGIPVMGPPLPGEYEHPTGAERRAARHLHVPADYAKRLARILWGHSLDDERDARLEPSPDPETVRLRRGHVTRDLYSEMERKLEEMGLDQATQMAQEWEDDE